MSNASTSPAPRPVPPLSAAHLRAFIHARSMKPGRPDVLRYCAGEIAQAMARLTREESVRCLALLPAGVQIAVVLRLDRHVRDQLQTECHDWGMVVPVLRAAHSTVAQSVPLGQMTPVGRI